MGENRSLLVDRRVGMLVFLLTFSNFTLCRSLNDEGLALLKFKEGVASDPFDALLSWREDDELAPCSWLGVRCAKGRVIHLNLEDLHLRGTLVPELTQLVHLQFLILRNNAFSGLIPKGFENLKELKVLDLRCNDLSGPLPSDLGSNLSLVILLDGNEFTAGISSQLYELPKLRLLHVDKIKYSAATRCSCKKRLTERRQMQRKHAVRRHLLVKYLEPYPKMKRSPIIAGSPTVSPSPESAVQAPPSKEPQLNNDSLSPGVTVTPHLSPAPHPSTRVGSKDTSKNYLPLVAGTIGGFMFLAILAVGTYLYRSNKVKSVNPWRTGLSGQLQKVFRTGVPKLNRPELEAACEDFSNIIGSSAIGTLYKGTLSSGVEIAVASIAAESSKDWSRNLEMLFRKKIETLSKVNHKNFVNLIGYCEEEQPFTRMMVFEYAPNGTLFEHLHFKESEHLNWSMRLRIAMGIAYCLEHMHQLNPPVIHKNLTSSSICLTEDYAAKVAELSFWKEVAINDPNCHEETTSSANQSEDLPRNVYSFGVLLFEMMTGRLPYLVDNAPIEDWASDYMRGGESMRETLDPTLESFDEGQLLRICELIRNCICPDPRQRPEMREVTGRLREITGLTPDGASPLLSPLWWAELEVLSAS